MTVLSPVTSSNIAAIGHDPATNELHVQFKSGATHVFSGVTAEQHEAMRDAESVGKHFHAHVKGKFDSRKVSG